MSDLKPTGDPAIDAKAIVDNARADNLQYEQRTGKPSNITEAAYLAAEDELRKQLEKLAALGPPRLTTVEEEPATPEAPSSSVADIER